MLNFMYSGMFTQGRVLTAAIVLVAAGLLSGCGAITQIQNKGRTVSSQEKAGGINLAVTQVAPWENYAEFLQPKFTLKSGDDALKKILKNTAILENKVIDAINAQARLTTPSSSIARKFTETASTDGTTTGSQTVTKERKAGTVPGKDEIPDAAGSDKTQISSLSDRADEIGTDQMLAYTAATALYQEVQLLNRYVKDAALRYGYQPYIVRLQIGVMPHGRNLPYDIVSTLGFFTDAPWMKDGKFVGYNEGISPFNDHPVYVIPLLVTDNLEGTLQSNAVRNVRQIGMALNFLVQGFGGTLGTEKVRDALQTALGTDFNSLLTVGKVSDNTIQVRLGAANQGSVRHAMIPRTHNVTVLLLVPKEYVTGKENPPKNGWTYEPAIKVLADKALYHSETGEAVARPTLSFLNDRIKEQIIQSPLYPKIRPEDLDGLVTDMARNFFQNNYDAFQEVIFKKLTVKGRTYAREFWLAFAQTAAISNFASDTFHLPKVLAPSAPLNQDVFLVDDGKSKTTATLFGGRGLRAGQMAARVLLKDGTTLAATGVATDNGRNPTLTFPSLAAAKIKFLERNGNVLILCRDTYEPWKDTVTDSTPSDLCGDLVDLGSYGNVHYKNQATPPPTVPDLYTIRQQSKTISAGKNKSGDFTFHVEANEVKLKNGNKAAIQEIRFSIEGPQVDKVEVKDANGKPVSGGGTARLGAYSAPASSSVTLTLSNLQKNVEVLVKIDGYDSVGDKTSSKNGNSPDLTWQVAD